MLLLHIFAPSRGDYFRISGGGKSAMYLWKSIWLLQSLGLPLQLDPQFYSILQGFTLKPTLPQYTISLKKPPLAPRGWRWCYMCTIPNTRPTPLLHQIIIHQTLLHQIIIHLASARAPAPKKCSCVCAQNLRLHLKPNGGWR